MALALEAQHAQIGFVWCDSSHRLFKTSKQRQQLNAEEAEAVALESLWDRVSEGQCRVQADAGRGRGSIQILVHSN
eukprot:2131857-Amphidinium_carterae.1